MVYKKPFIWEFSSYNFNLYYKKYHNFSLTFFYLTFDTLDGNALMVYKKSFIWEFPFYNFILYYKKYPSFSLSFFIYKMYIQKQ